MQDDVRSAVPRMDHQEKTGSAKEKMSNEHLGFREGEYVERAVAESLSKNLIAAHPVQCL